MGDDKVKGVDPAAVREDVEQTRALLEREDSPSQIEGASESWQQEAVIYLSAMADHSEQLLIDRDKLQKFKDYVHQRLDAAGVSPDPDSPHKTEGCRVGGRLDEVFAERDALRAQVNEWEAAANCVGFAQQCRRMAEAAAGALGQPFDETSPADITEGFAAMRQRVAELEAELKLWRPLTPAEAEQALAEAEAVPLSGERIAEIVSKATDPAATLTNSEQAQMAARIKELEAGCRFVLAHECDDPCVACAMRLNALFAPKPEGGA